MSWLGYGLECQQCGQKGNGLCFDFDDNGETVECRDGLDACWLYQISKNLTPQPFNKYSEFICFLRK